MLACVQWFSPFSDKVAENVNMFRIRMTDELGVVPLATIRQTVHVVPDFGGLKVAELRWNADNVFEKVKTFFLNDHVSMEAFKTLM